MRRHGTWSQPEREAARREEVRCHLHVFSATLTPERVTDHVGVQPTTARHRGYRPRPGAGLEAGLPEHQWTWEPSGDVPLTLDAQLDEIWSALATRAAAFRDLLPDAKISVDIVIDHYDDVVGLRRTSGMSRWQPRSALGSTLTSTTTPTATEKPPRTTTNELGVQCRSGDGRQSRSRAVVARPTRGTFWTRPRAHHAAAQEPREISRRRWCVPSGSDEGSSRCHQVASVNSEGRSSSGSKPTASSLSNQAYR